MVAKLIIFLVSISTQAFALEAMVTVLDAPVFSDKNEKSKILFYKRKGDSIYLHNGSRPGSDEKFYKTLIPSGKEAFILKEHVIIVFKDKREIGQKVIQFDHTDYRLPEPLPKNYPLRDENLGYRGHFQIALGQPNLATYPYNQKVLDSSFELSKAFNFIYTNKADLGDLKDNLYFGAIAGFQLSAVEFVLKSQVAKQSQTTFYIGPHLNYEAYTKETIGINLYLNLQLLLYNNVSIELKDNDTDQSETRDYSNPIGLSPNIGSSINFKKSFLDFDTLLGFNLRGIIPNTFTTSSEADEPQLWNDGSEGDNFNQSLRVELSYFLGIRASY